MRTKVGEGRDGGRFRNAVQEDNHARRRGSRLPGLLRELCHIYVRVWGPSRYRVTEEGFRWELVHLMAECRGLITLLEEALTHLEEVQLAWGEPDGPEVVEQQLDFPLVGCGGIPGRQRLTAAGIPVSPQAAEGEQAPYVRSDDEKAEEAPEGEASSDDDEEDELVALGDL